MIVYINGTYKPLHQARVSIMDRGFLYGDGVYETIRVYNGQPYLLKQHLTRLRQSARGLSLALPQPLPKIEKAVTATIKRNHHKEAVVRITLTRGPGPYGFDPRLCRRPTLVITSSPFHPYPSHYYEKGIRLAVVSVRRNSPRSIPPWIKSTNCLNGILAKIESIHMKAEEGLFLTLEGDLSEGTVSNIFIVKNRTVRTPPCSGHRLPGVTRKRVCQLVKKSPYNLKESLISLRQLLAADEIFMTNTTMEIMPVREVVYKKRVCWRRRGLALVTSFLHDQYKRQRES